MLEEGGRSEQIQACKCLIKCDRHLTGQHGRFRELVSELSRTIRGEIDAGEDDVDRMAQKKSAGKASRALSNHRYDRPLYFLEGL